MTSVAPFAVFFIGAVLAALTRGRARSIVMLAIPIVGALNLMQLDQGIYGQIPFLGQELAVVRVDKLSLLFGYLFHLAAFIGIVYSLHLRDTTQHVAGVVYAGSAIGATFAGDLITLFVFWEFLAVSSVFLILARRTARAQAAGMRYLIIQVLSGVTLLAGALVRVHETGSIAFDFIGLEGLAGWLIFLAFGLKCAFPLLHNWL
ncbi:MAG: proton-conducting transporter membrane subunit, partial [Kiloniellaceae bacterium]